MAKLLLLIFSTIIAWPGFSQHKELDSLLNELKSHLPEDMVRLDLLNQISNKYRNTNPDKGIEAGDKAISLALKLNSKVKLATAYINKGTNFEAKSDDSSALGLYYKALSLFLEMDEKSKVAELLYDLGLIYQKSDYSKALDYYQKSLVAFEQLHDNGNAARVLRSIGVVYTFLSDYPRALEYQQKALNIFELSGNKRGMAAVFANLGLIYTYLENFQKSLEYHQKALGIYKQLDNKKGMADELGNIGNVYDNLNDSANAIQSYQTALRINSIAGNQQGIASDLSNIGIIYNYYGRYAEAFKYLSKALVFYEQSGDKSNTSLILNEFSKIFCSGPAWLLLQYGINPKERYNKAVHYLDRALTLAKEAGSVSRQLSAWESLSNTYERDKDFARALNAYKHAVILKDSSLDDEKEEITRLEMQYDFNKKEALTKAANDKKDALAGAEIKRQKVIRNASIGIGSMLVVVAIAGIILYKRRKDTLEKKREAEFNVQVADTEMKALRAQMNPHFIFNSLNSINDYIDKNNISKATLYTTRFAKLMRMILENSEQKEIPLADDLKALELYLQLESMRMPGKFSYQVIIDADIDRENTLIPPLILQPFVENSIWHGISKKQDDGQIWIHIKKEGDMINCIVEDNGIGLPESMANDGGKQSLGMKLTRARIDIINKLKKSNAEVHLFNKERGVRAEVRLPLELSF